MEVRSVGRGRFFSGGASCCLLATSSGLVIAANDACSHALSFRFPTFVTCRSLNEFPLPSHLIAVFGIAAGPLDYHRFSLFQWGLFPLDGTVAIDRAWHRCQSTFGAYGEATFGRLGAIDSQRQTIPFGSSFIIHRGEKCFLTPICLFPQPIYEKEF